MYTKGQMLYLVVCPRTRPRTFVNCFASELSVFKTKQLRIVLGQKTRYKTRPLALVSNQPALEDTIQIGYQLT